MSNEAKCPFNHSARTTNRDWWPNQLPLDTLHQRSALSDPMGEDFNYAEEFQSLDYAALKKDLRALMTDSQEWWPADFGHYGPLFIRMAWHSAGTYRTGRWPRRRRQWQPALRAAEQLAGQRQPRQGAPAAVAHQAEVRAEDFLGGSHDPHRQRGAGIHGGLQDLRLRWRAARTSGSRRPTSTGARRRNGWTTSATPATASSPILWLAVQMGLIYVNPEGPNGNPDPLLAARDIRETFKRMAMNDEETVALIAGGHTFGKTHGAGDAALVGVDPEAGEIEAQGLGWASTHGTGRGGDAITSGLEVTWTTTPTRWSNDFFDHLFGYEWELTKSPAGAHHGRPGAVQVRARFRMPMTQRSVADPPCSRRIWRCASTRRTKKISRRFHDDPQQFAEAFARAWFKLTHRDMGPRARYLGPEVPKEDLLWQDPPSAGNACADRRQGHRDAEGAHPCFGSFRSRAGIDGLGLGFHLPCSDKRGGANGARVRLAPQKELGSEPAGAAGEGAEKSST